MTTVYERTRSVIETSDFLLRLIRDKSLPDTVRNEARLLLRHYPTADTVRLAGRWEAIRQDEVSKLPGSPKALHPALATWPLLEPLFCDSELPDAPGLGAQSDLATLPALHPIPRAEGDVVAADFHILGLAAPKGMGCLSIDYRRFTSARAQVLSRATVVLGSPASASSWFVGRVRTLDKRQPCTLMNTVQDFISVMETLSRLEYGIYW
ncbi:MbcA/ParS/Xre antitoxin family protein [Pseudomonas sp. LS-2]|uniref:MbcA/ParS/Xre antitoxin family protein n=1 Tax=Pseudomonas sp. LS-2 TaxID=2315859 RepID=UPI000E752FC1|nr:MbcA/ParS/Xre antitoxin family protein [Pseudomonas sp. LS-2]RJX82160.1 DUF2384 domain-containing protein [Pseudomonas sp. LS-2]